MKEAVLFIFDKRCICTIDDGIVGLSALEEIRKIDYNGRNIIIGGEEYLTYNIIKFSLFISKEEHSIKDILIHDKNWHKERAVEVLLDTKGINIDT